MRYLILLTALFTCLASNAEPQMTITSSVNDGTLAIGESTTLTFTSSEPVTNGTFTIDDVLLRASSPGTLTNFQTINASTYTATYTAAQTEEIAILMDEGAFTAASGDSAMVQFGLNYKVCYVDNVGSSRYDSNRLVFPKFGEMVAENGVTNPTVNHVPCYRKQYIDSRKVYKFEPAAFKPILLSADQYLTPDPSKQTSHGTAQNTVHRHTGNFVKTWDMTKMKYQGGAVGSSAERIKYANHDTYTAAGYPDPGGHHAVNGGARVSVGPLVVNGLRYQDNITDRGNKVSGHLHGIHGNGGANYLMTPSQIQNSGTSNAFGGIINRTLYWMPALIRLGTGEPVMNGDMQVYYKAGAGGFGNVQWFPDGLVMIAGNVPSGAFNNDAIAWSCSTATGHQAGNKKYLPHCKYDPNVSGGKVVQTIIFPSCWDGVNLDSVDHMSHMAHTIGGFTPFGDGTAVCPATHPVALPVVTENIHIKLQPGDDTATWGLSSDDYPFTDLQRGKRLHADWIHGWNRSLALEWLAECQNMPIDCGVDYVGRTAPIEISTITHSGTTATVTTPVPHGLWTGLLVQTLGADQPEYNGDTLKVFNVKRLTCDSNKSIVSVTHSVPANFTGISYGIPFSIVGANEAGFNVSDTVDSWTGINQFHFRLDVGKCPAATATGAMQVLIDNGVPKQRVTVVDDYTFTYELPSMPSSNATGKLFFRVGRKLY